MIVFNEGIPGAGKSYDSVVNHILPALARGRHVFARLNGLKFDGIAAHLGVSVDRIRELLHVIDNEEVTELPSMVCKDALVVIDECHEWFVASRQPIAEHHERFFAMHRHLGLDIVLISQHYKRVHSAVRARVERKVLFKKMAFLGMASRYEAVAYQSVAPDQYEKLGSRIGTYDPAIFKLYASVQPGTENLELYQQKTASVWRRPFVWAGVPLAAIALVWGVSALLGFFSPKARSEPAPKPAETARTSPGGRGAVGPQAMPAPTATGLPGPLTPPKPAEPPNVQYVLDLLAVARPRLAAVAMVDGGVPHCQIEFRAEGGGSVNDALTCDDLRALGWFVGVDAGGRFATIVKGEHKWIATSWPVSLAYGIGGNGYTSNTQGIQPRSISGTP